MPDLSIHPDDFADFSDLEDRIEEQLASNIASLNAQWEALSEEIDTYEKYVANAEQVSKFYQDIVAQTEQMCIVLYEYTAVYTRMVLDSDLSADDQYDAIDDIIDCLYNDACDEICDEIYDALLDDMSDYFYNGILDDIDDDIDYSDWYDVISDEYSQWYDTCSDVYELYYDTASDIYSFCYDMSGELYSENYERAEKLYERFLVKIAEAKGYRSEQTNVDAIFDTALKPADNVEDLETIVNEHVLECVQALYAEWEALSADVDTFDSYLENCESIEAFHKRTEDAAHEILLMICNYGVSYADLILQSDASARDMYKDFEDFLDCIYEDACETVHDEIYEDLLEDIKDYYYDGIIDDAKDSIPYSDWSDARSDSYDWWSDARSEVYGDWSDVRSDLYSLYSDIRSELYDKDIEKAKEELQDFRDSLK